MYSVATATRHITRKVTLVSNASGEIDLVVLPNAYQHAVSPRGNLPGGSDSWFLGDGTTVANGAVRTVSTALALQLTNYRIVGYGLKVIGTAAMTTNSGTIVLATVPAESYVNDKNAPVGGQNSNINNATMTATRTLSAYGIPVSSGVVQIPSLVTLPNSVEASMVNISEHPIMVTPKICSPSAFTFKQSDDSGPGYNIQSQTSTVSVSAGNASYLSFGGFETVVLAATGCPANTSMLDVEITYHLEGTPYTSSTTGQVIGSDSVSQVVDPVAWMGVIRDVASMPSFKSLVEGVGNSFFPGLGTMVGRLL